MIIEKVKAFYKKYKFSQHSTAGKNFVVCSRANCHGKKENIKIGDDCLIYGTLCAVDDGKITIGDNTCIFENTFVASVKDIKIGNCVIISNNVKIYDNNNHPTSPKVRHEMCRKGFFGEDWKWTQSKMSPVVIEDDVWIGENVTILKGVTIGKGSVVATRSVVTKDVPKNCIVAGNPARVVKENIDVE